MSLVCQLSQPLIAPLNSKLHDFPAFLAEDLPFERSSFDIVLSYLTFIDIADLQAAS